MALQCKSQGGAVECTLKIVPGSSRTSIEGELDGMLKMKVAAAPEKGKANKEVVAFLAERLGVRKNDIEILSGHTSPVKRIHIKGALASELEALAKK
jgi:uncharacterized protein (TIGR00251 family)